MFRVFLGKRWVQFWHSTFIPLVISGWLRYFNFARLKGNCSKRGTLSFLPFFPFFPPPFLLFFLPFFRDVSTNLAYFEKRRVRVSARSSTLVDDETRLHTRNPRSSSRVERTPSFPRCTVIRWFSRIPGEVFLRFEETVSGFPQHLRRTREGDTERTKHGSTRRHRPSFLSLATTSTYACHRLYFIFPKDCVCFVGTRDVFVNIRLWNLVLKRKRWRLVPWTVGFLFYFVFRSFWKIIHQGKRCVKIGAFIYWDKFVFSILC